jgi:predicted DNA-binding transcriptional regulator YafY
VEAERGRAGGYRLRPGFRLPPLMLDPDEATAVTLGLLAARRLGLTSAEPAVDRALAKILRVLPPALRERALALDEAVGFTEGPAPASPRPRPPSWRSPRPCAGGGGCGWSTAPPRGGRPPGRSIP